jgi:hypothetical protein
MCLTQRPRLTKRAALFARAIAGLRQAAAAIEEAAGGRHHDILAFRGAGLAFTVEVALSALESDCPPEALSLLNKLPVG